MDIQNASRLLFDWFETHDGYNHSLNYKLLDWNSIEKENAGPESEQEAAILAALSILSEDKFLYKIESKNSSKKDAEPTWVVLRSQKENPTTIELSKETAVKISKIVNSILPMMDINITEQSNPKALGEADLLVICQGYNILSEQLSRMIAEKENDKKDNPKQ